MLKNLTSGLDFDRMISSPWGEVLPESLQRKKRRAQSFFWPQSTLTSVASSNAPLLFPDNRTQTWLIPYALSSAAIGVEVGDLMYDAGSDVAYPAGQQATQASEAADQVLFTSNFIGISLDKVLSTETNAVRRITILTEGVKVFDCPSTTWAKGDLVGIYSDGSNSPVSQKVDKVTTIDKAIGVCVEAGTSVTTVKVYFVAKNYTGWAAMSGTVGDITLDSLVGGDSSLGISGESAAQGGAIAITGGTSSTGGNAGGALTMAGGTGGAAGAGGAVSLVGGVPASGNAAGGAGTFSGGAGSGTGAGGAVTTKGGASGTGATGNGGAWSGGGGAALSTNGTGGAATLTGGVGTGTGVGGAVTITGGSSGGASGTGGAVAIDAGAAAGGTAGAITIGATNATSTKIGNGGAESAAIKAIVYSGTIAVTVPSITDPDIAKVDVSTSSLTFAAAVGDVVIAIPLEALPTNCRLQGAWVNATDQVQITFGSEGGSVTGAAKNFGFLFIDLT